MCFEQLLWILHRFMCLNINHVKCSGLILTLLLFGEHKSSTATGVFYLESIIPFSMCLLIQMKLTLILVL